MHGYLVLTTPNMIAIAILLARLFIGICFVVHGLGKLGIVGSGNMQGFAGWLKSMGLPFAEAQARMAMLSEIVGGSLITLGLLTRVGLALCFFTMLIAASIGHKGGGYLIGAKTDKRHFLPLPPVGLDRPGSFHLRLERNALCCAPPWTLFTGKINAVFVAILEPWA